MAFFVILVLEALAGILAIVIISGMFLFGLWGMTDTPIHDPAAPVGAIESGENR